MPASVVDTSVLLYLALSDAAKADRAEAVIAAGGAISAQVLDERANVARRKMRMSWADTHAFLTMLRSLLTIHPLTSRPTKQDCRWPSGMASPPMTP
jgi:predicted nucleic acid-binding protein